MILISKINIEYYRSLKWVSIKDVNHLNIFSGKNDVGKSNVLKALDTFFNKNEISFVDDFNKERLSEVRKDSVKGKQYIKITLEFVNPGTYKTLPKKFKVTKSWDRNGYQIEGVKDNFDNLKKNHGFKTNNIDIARRTLTGFLNKIRYTYVPAIRDERFFSYLLNKLQEVIFEVEERKKNAKFKSTLKTLNTEIGGLTSSLNSEFERITGITSTLSLPTEIAEIFQRLIIDTKSGDHEIPLRLRGDGIRLRYIPTILDYISANSKYYEIWGFDEPENSCEYSLTKSISQQFAKEYTNQTQIFVASHAFHFITLEDSKVSKFRVYRQDGISNSEVALISESNKDLLSSELGVLDINTELGKLYDSLSSEAEVMKGIRNEMDEISKPYILTEGKTDNLFFEKAFKALYKRKIDTVYTLCGHLSKEDGASVGSGATFLNQFLYNHAGKIPVRNKIIAVFDFDETGMNELKALSKMFVRLDAEEDVFFLFQHKTMKNVYAISLVIPDHRADFFSKKDANYSFVSTELLLQDSAIPASNRMYPTKFDKTVFSFTGKKELFVQALGSDIDYDGFKPTFELIRSIIRGRI